MHNIHELEKRWLYYKVKSYIPHTVIAILSIILIITLSTFEATNVNTVIITAKKETTIQPISPKKITKTEPTAPVSAPIVEPLAVKQPILVTRKKIQKQIILKPSLDFMKKLSSTTSNIFPSHVITTQHNNTQTTNTSTIVPVKEETTEIKAIKKPQKILQISRKETKTDIQEVIKRFKTNNNPALSLFIAKKYYRLGEYHKSYNYALITNKINSDIEASWIIFSKSLVKLNEKEMAIKVLKKYIKQSHSSNAQILLNNISSGKFK